MSNGRTASLSNGRTASLSNGRTALLVALALLVQSAVLPALAVGAVADTATASSATAEPSVNHRTTTGTTGATGATATTDADVLVVDDDGDTAYETIRAAVAAAEDGDTIRVRPGEYSPDGSVVIDANVTITAPDGARITGRAYPGENTTIRGEDFPAVFEIPSGSDAAPVIRGFTLTGRPLLESYRAGGDLVLRDLTIRKPVRTPVSVPRASGDWLLDNVTVVTNATAVDALHTTGAWAIQDSTFRLTEERSVYEMIEAFNASGPWTIRDTTISGATIGVSAHAASGPWTMNGVTIRDTVVGVSAYRASGDWTIQDATFGDTAASSRLDFMRPPLVEGVAVFAAETSGDWTVRETTFQNSSRVDVFASDATQRGDARGNSWDGSATPDADACTGNVTCNGSPTDEPVGTPTPTGEEPNPYRTTVTAGDSDAPLAAGPGQVVSGTTALPAGTELSVTVRTTTGTTLLARHAAVVGHDGRFRAVFDLSDLDAGTEYDVLVNRDGERIASVSGTLTTCDVCDTASDGNATTIYRDGRNVTVAAEPGQIVSGRTDLPPGATVTVRLTYTSGQAFIKSRDVTVGADGRFRAVFNFSGLDAGTTFEAVVRADDRTVVSAPGLIVDCADAPDAEVCRSETATPTASQTERVTRAPKATGETETTVTPAKHTESTTGHVSPSSSDHSWLVIAGLLGAGSLFGIVGIALLLGIVEI
jgi:hypothetical protein